MAISNNSTGLRPGVCTSTTRPTAPYEGQMIYETDTDLTYVWGGSAWQQVSGGTAVGNSGLVYITSATIGSGVTTASVANCFSSTYDNYFITVTGGSNAGGSAVLQLQLGSATTNYNYQLIYADWGSTVSGSGSTTGGNFSYVGSGNADGLFASVILRSPNLAKWTSMSTDASRTPNYWGVAGGVKKDTTQYTGFTIITDTGTMTGGTIAVYGYRKA